MVGIHFPVHMPFYHHIITNGPGPKPAPQLREGLRIARACTRSFFHVTRSIPAIGLMSQIHFFFGNHYYTKLSAFRMLIAYKAN